MVDNNLKIDDIDNMSDEDFMSFMENSTDSSDFFTENEAQEEMVQDKEPESSEEIKESNVNINVVVDDKVVTEEAEDSNQELEPVEPENETEDLDKKEIEELRRYKEQISSKFEANGLELEGITDPKELIELQKDHVLKTEIAKKYNKARPILDALGKNNLIEDREKLALAIQASNGNVDAMKELMRQNEVDPIMMDLEDINKESFDPSKVFESEVETKFNDFIEKSSTMGVEDTLVNGVLDKWGNDSVAKLIDEPGAKDVLLSHMKTGAFNKVNAEILEIERRDSSGYFSAKSDYDKYVIASNSLANKLAPKAVEEETHVQNVDNVSTKNVEPTATVETVSVETSTGSEPDDKQARLENAIKASNSSEVTDKATIKTSKPNLMDLDNDSFMKEMNKMLG